MFLTRTKRFVFGQNLVQPIESLCSLMASRTIAVALFWNTPPRRQFDWRGKKTASSACGGRGRDRTLGAQTSPASAPIFPTQKFFSWERWWGGGPHLSIFGHH